MKATKDDVYYHRPRGLREPDGEVQLYRVTRDGMVHRFIYHGGDRVALTASEAEAELAEGRIEPVTPETEQAERAKAAYAKELAEWSKRNPHSQVPLIEGASSSNWHSAARKG
jgi:hypothetical protein